MHKKKKLTIFIVTFLIITIAAIFMESSNNKTILNLHMGNTPVACKFEIGQTREEIKTILDNAGLSYADSKNRDKIDCIFLYDEVAILEYWFVIGSDNRLHRIDTENAVDGRDVILPKNYRY